MADFSIYKTNDFEFDFSKREIRFYRKRYNFSTIPFTEVKYIEVRKGRTVQNVWFLVIISGLLFILAILLFGNLFDKLNGAGNYSAMSHSDIRMIGANIAISASSLFFASYFFYAITKKEVVLKINHNSKPYPLNELARVGVLEKFYEEMNDNFTIKIFDLN